MKPNNKNTSLWIRVAQIAGAFTFIISMLLIVNYAQYKRIDPVGACVGIKGNRIKTIVNEVGGENNWYY